jgi:hypothetical protein
MADGRTTLGAQDCNERLEQAIKAAGFTRVHEPATSPFNVVLEARQ